jgi:methylenetetrahydrofolate reductase (NADPH)
MAAPAPIPTNRRPAAIERIVAFAAGFSLEATRPSDADIDALSTLKRGTRIYLSAIPNRPIDESIGRAVRLRAAGLEPVPHIAVRNFPSVEAFDDVLARFNGEASVQSVLVIAGDRAESGPLRRALDAIDSGVLRRRGIRSVGIAGYPEGHPRIADDELHRALIEKISAAQGTGLTVEIVTQLCFDAGAILNFIAQLRAFGFDHHVRVGLAGPTSLTALMRYASRCGVRASAQGLARSSGLMRQMFTMTTPDNLVRALANTALAGVTPHFFSFGGIPATSRWARAVADGHIALEGGDGFRVEPPKSDGTN